MPGLIPRQIDPNTILRRRLREDRFTVIEDNDMYRGAGGAGADLGTIVAGDVVGASVGAVPFNGNIGASGPFTVLGRHSVLLTGTSFSSTATGTTIVFTVEGFDLDNNAQSEDVSIIAATGVTQSKSTVNIFSEITRIVIKSIAGGTLNAAPLFAVGHGVSTVAGSQGICRFPVSPKIVSTGEIRRLVGPNGLPIAISLDATRHVLLNASGTTLVAGEYRIVYEWLRGQGEYV